MSRITPERKIICGLDIGTTKICTIIGNYNETTSEYSVLGIVKVPSSGMKGGIIVDMDKTRDSIDRSVKMALKKAGLEKLDSATIGIAGAHIRSLDAVRSININNSDSKSDANIINKENIDQL